MRPSYWSGEIDGGAADLVIIGAGFAGLSSALACAAAQPGIRIVVIDREGPGGGASGRNGGMVIPFPLIPMWLMPGSAPGHDPAELNRLLMQRLAETLDSAVGEAVQAKPADIVVAAKSWFWQRGLSWVAQRAAALDVAAERLGPAEMAAQYASTARAGLRFPGRGIQPWRAAQALADKVTAAGVEILRGVEALRLDPAEGGEVRITTDSGVLVARRVVVATNAYGGELAGLPPLGTRVFSYVLATAPLTAEQAKAIGGETLFDELDTGIYRRVEDGRLIFGALDKIRSTASERHATDPKARAELREMLARSLPMLADVPIEREWGGAFMQRSGAPFVGPHPALPGVWINSGYGGAGVALSLLSGSLVAGMLWPEADTEAAAAIRAGYAATRIPWLALPGVGLAALRA